MATTKEKGLGILCLILWGLLIFVSVHDVALTIRHNKLVHDYNEDCSPTYDFFGANIDAVEVGVINESWYNQTV